MNATNATRTTWEVVAGNVGTVYSGHSLTVAESIYRNYVSLSSCGYGRLADEPIMLLCNGEPIQEHIPVSVR